MDFGRWSRRLCQSGAPPPISRRALAPHGRLAHRRHPARQSCGERPLSDEQHPPDRNPGVPERSTRLVRRPNCVGAERIVTDIDVFTEIVPLALGSSVVGGLLTAGIAGLREAAASRREGYAQAARALVARSEYPYRVRRRTSDDGQTLNVLAEIGHGIQEQLTASRIWVALESPRMGEHYRRALERIDETVRPATQDAWEQSPIDRGSRMNLDGWGPRNPDATIAAFERAARWRFGPRRLIPFTPHVQSIRAPVD